MCPKSAVKNSKLPFTQSTYLSLASAWQISPSIIRTLSQNLSLVMLSSPSTSPSSIQPNNNSFGTSSGTKNPTTPTSTPPPSLLIHNAEEWTWDYTLHLTYTPASRATQILVTGLTATEMNLMIRSISSLLARQPNSALAPTYTHPFLVPIVLLDLAVQETADSLAMRTKVLREIQTQTGMDRFNTLKSRRVGLWNRGSMTAACGSRCRGEELMMEEGAMGERTDGLDLDAVMLRLTCLSDWVAAQKGVVSMQRSIRDVLIRMREGEGFGDSVEGGDVTIFYERLDFIEQSLVAAERKCDYLERSIDAQVQTIYTLVAQKDNQTNIAAASASYHIASSSRRIAILTRKDSTDMRIIAAVTLVFLPGTFVATLFSTGLFDWGYGDPTSNDTDNEKGSQDGGQKVVSRYIWVYFMLTGVLTGVVLVAWVLFSCLQKRIMMKRFGDDCEGEGPGDYDGWRQGKRELEKPLSNRLNVGGGLREKIWGDVRTAIERKYCCDRAVRVERELKGA
ncbi:hypothetical protein BU24DRAFT_494212 [Aaosphaeria arxii CBS 175.79]|uniref:Cora-domain-containing protein n=1 Tax=Aaosphaeria arxii CBS 175.79 TaxID=1450172 RepID=A0A6A5XM44_9PLEO|nr:uncharacterized protein BU24DRAFT_494212 [Aaosphaeria arxii CBS 175.79]KAF2013810.1 hypothetical protein BU24DRAFT_494212 [Aaosphaeria arxii CBS 175.79]